MNSGYFEHYIELEGEIGGYYLDLCGIFIIEIKIGNEFKYKERNFDPTSQYLLDNYPPGTKVNLLYHRKWKNYIIRLAKRSVNE